MQRQLNRHVDLQLKWIVLGSLLAFVAGFEAGAELIRTHTASASESVQGSESEAKDETIKHQDRSLELARQTIGDLQARLAQQRTEITAGKNNAGAQLLAESGHVMNEQQCRQWAAAMNPMQPATSSAPLPGSDSQFTVLYEAGRPSLNISLLPMPGAPRVGVGNSEMAPRWVIPSKIQPQMIGETRKALYYYFDVPTSQWQGPFSPARVMQ